MSEVNCWERLIVLMGQERVLLDDFALAAGELRNGLHRRDWTLLESALGNLDSLASRLDSLERRRASLTDQICGAEEPERRIAALDAELRRRVMESRSELKARIVAVQSRTRGVATYARSQAKLGQNLMEELIPSTRGRMYDKQGRRASAGRDPMVLSRRL